MFNIGGQEFLVILVLALVVLGPERLPTVARQVGQAIGTVRTMAQSFQAEFEQAVQAAEVEARLDENAATAPPASEPEPPEPDKINDADAADARALAAEAQLEPDSREEPDSPEQDQDPEADLPGPDAPEQLDRPLDPFSAVAAANATDGPAEEHETDAVDDADQEVPGRVQELAAHIADSEPDRSMKPKSATMTDAEVLEAP